MLYKYILCTTQYSKILFTARKYTCIEDNQSGEGEEEQWSNRDFTAGSSLAATRHGKAI